MKSYHLLFAIVVAFIVGAVYPAPVNWLRAKAGV